MIPGESLLLGFVMVPFPAAAAQFAVSCEKRKMSKARPYLFAALALALGFGLGVRYMTLFSERTEAELKMRAQEDRIDIAVRTLRQLRAGSTNTSEFLEIQLDDAVLALEHLLSESPTVYGARNGREMILRAKAYRAQFPHASTQPWLDEKVARIFAPTNEPPRN